ncbi:MAG: hypothetical protein J3K34DRAFT_465786 [Monoraphidium minutum]|nr:MAG: hypothetical protein J3K34DRAFT_465786 [Monoraphidium minutum]
MPGMEQRPGGASLLQKAGAARAFRAAGELRPARGLGRGAGPSLGVVPGRRLGRTATLSKGFRLMQPPAALPLFDMGVAVIDSLNLMKASMEEEVVLTSALSLPAHRALACRFEAYGSPFTAPRLHEVLHGTKALTEADRQFASCIAAPPDFDAAPGGVGQQAGLSRMLSLGALQRSASAAGGASGGGAAAAQPPGGAARARAGQGAELFKSPSVAREEEQKEGRRRATSPGGARGGSLSAAGCEGCDGFAASGGGAAEVGAAAAAAALAAAGGGPRRVWTSEGPGAGGAAPGAGGDEETPQAQLLAYCGDAVAALVGVGYLLLVAGRFSRAAPRAVGRLLAELRRLSMSSGGGGGGARGARPVGAGASAGGAIRSTKANPHGSDRVAMETSARTVRRPSRGAALSHATPSGAAPAGLGSALGVHPKGARLGRTATLAKWTFMQGGAPAGSGGGGLKAPAALPLFDVSVAVLQSLDDIRGTDAALAATLHAPAHQILACQAEAYGTPFKAPALQALDGVDVSRLSDNDLEFAACLAAPPEMEEVPELSVQHRLIRMASLARLQVAPTELRAELRAEGSASLRPFGSGSVESRLQKVLDINARLRRAPASGASRTRSHGEDADADGGAALARAASAALAARQQSGGEAALQLAAVQEGKQAVGAQDATQSGQRDQSALRRAPSAAGELLLAGGGDPVAALVGIGALLVRGFGPAAAAGAAALGKDAERRARALLHVHDFLVGAQRRGAAAAAVPAAAPRALRGAVAAAAEA